jgi:hypothetical protein
MHQPEKTNPRGPLVLLANFIDRFRGRWNSRKPAAASTQETVPSADKQLQSKTPPKNIYPLY